MYESFKVNKSQMNFSITATNIKKENQCPICKAYIDPIKLYSYHGEDDVLSIVQLCRKCNNIFITEYLLNLGSNYGDNNYLSASMFKLIRSYPNEYIETKFSEFLEKCSPQFVKIYNQSQEAISNGLDEIAGIGCRKALEFLVKDYCIYLSVMEDENFDTSIIKKMNLIDVVKKYIEYDKLSDILIKTIWIANDFTHYEQFHDYDLEELLSVISVCVSLIIGDLERINHSQRIQHKNQK